jgi:hypothetical protein
VTVSLCADEGEHADTQPFLRETAWRVELGAKAKRDEYTNNQCLCRPLGAAHDR